MVSTKSLLVFAALTAAALGGTVRRNADKSGSSERHHHEPAFMEGLDDSTKDQFKAIFRNHSLEGEAKDAALLKLATSVLKPDQLTEFKTHQAEWVKRRAQWKAEYDAKYEKLSPAARQAADQLKALCKDDTLNHTAKKAKKEEILKTLSDADRKDVRSLPRLHHRHHMPKFMRDLPQDIQDKFKAIWRNHTLKGEAKDAAFNELAQSVLTAEQMTEFKAHMAKKAEWRAEMEAKLAKLSPNARKAADAIHAIMENEDLSWEEKKQQKDAIKAGLTDDERAELKALRHHHSKEVDEDVKPIDL